MRPRISRLSFKTFSRAKTTIRSGRRVSTRSNAGRWAAIERADISPAGAEMRCRSPPGFSKLVSLGICGPRTIIPAAPLVPQSHFAEQREKSRLCAKVCTSRNEAVLLLQEHHLPNGAGLKFEHGVQTEDFRIREPLARKPPNGFVANLVLVDRRQNRLKLHAGQAGPKALSKSPSVTIHERSCPRSRIYRWAAGRSIQ